MRLEKFGWVLMMVAAVAITVVGCSQYEMTKPDGTKVQVKPDSFQDSVIIAYNGIAQARGLVVDLFKRQQIDKPQALAANAKLDEFRALVDQARSYWRGGNNADAMQLLDTVTGGLLLLETQLQEKANGKRSEAGDSWRGAHGSARYRAGIGCVAGIDGSDLQGGTGRARAYRGGDERCQG